MKSKPNRGKCFNENCTVRRGPDVVLGMSLFLASIELFLNNYKQIDTKRNFLPRKNHKIPRMYSTPKYRLQFLIPLQKGTKKHCMRENL